MTPSHALAEKHYALAVAGYSRAIGIDSTNAVYYANRAAAHIRVENYGLALADASKSIELDPRYVKVSLISSPEASVCELLKARSCSRFAM